MTFLKTVAATAALVMLGVGAQAATLNAVQEGNDSERSVADDYLWQNANTGGLAVIVGGAVDGDPEGFAYFDGDSGGPGGLGVCRTHLSLNCGDDDSLQEDERLRLEFAGPGVELSNIMLGDHGADLSGFFFTLEINGIGGFVPYLFSDAGGLVFEDVVKAEFGFYTGSCYDAAGAHIYECVEKEGHQYYFQGATATPIPIPAAGFLLLGGLGGLMALRRRKS